MHINVGAVLNCIVFPLSLAQASLRNSGNFHAQFLFRAFSPPFGLTLRFSPLFAVLNCIAFPPSLAQASLRNSGMGIYLLWLRFSLSLHKKRTLRFFFFIGEGDGNRTHVRKHLYKSISERSR